jgi:hypothetical protein
VGVEDGLQAPSFGAAGDPPEALVESPGAAGQDHAADGERQDGGDETDDEGAEVGLDERVEVDPSVLRWAARV